MRGFPGERARLVRLPIASAAVVGLLLLSGLPMAWLGPGPGQNHPRLAPESVAPMHLASRPARAAPADSVSASMVGGAGFSPTGGSTSVATVDLGAFSQPQFAAYNPANDAIYVPDFGGNNVSIIDASSHHVLATVPGGDDPYESLYDPVNGLVYTTNSGLTFNVTVINGTTNEAPVDAGVFPHFGAVDRSNGYVYVANVGSNNVTVISGDQAIATVLTGANPLYVAYDPSDGEIYVTNNGGSNVTVISGTTLVRNVSVGTTPTGEAYDPLDGDLYVANTGSNNVSILNGTTVVRSLPVGLGPTGVAFDPMNGYVYVSNGGSNNVSVFDGLSIIASVPTGGAPTGISVDPTDGVACVVNFATDNVSLLNGTYRFQDVDTGVAPRGPTFASAEDETYVSNYASGTVTVLGANEAPYTVTFNESGLAPSTDWGVRITPTTQYSTTPNLGIGEGNGTYSYSAVALGGYLGPVPGSVTVHGANVTVLLNFTPTYPVEFNETGLPPATNWSITMGSVTVASLSAPLTFDEPNGTYSYSITPIPGYSTLWAGTAHVSGRAVGIHVNFSEVRYNVWFNETGLPNGSSWGVVLAGGGQNTTVPSLQFVEQNGSFGYTVLPVPGYDLPPPGVANVRGSGVTVDIAFRTTTFGVSFDESGLPIGAMWGVHLGGGFLNSTATSITVVEPNGSYSFAVHGPVGYAGPVAGTVVVDGRNQSVMAPFTQLAYSVEFDETGLGPGTNWTVVLGGSSESASSAPIDFSVANGTYDYSILPVPGYHGGSAGIVTVAGGPEAVPTVFTAATFTVSFLEGGLPAGTLWGVSVDNASLTGRGQFLAFAEVNGTHPYSIDPVPGFSTNWTGSLTVSGIIRTVPVEFTETKYLVTVDQSGLSAGSPWGVAIGSLSANGSTPELSFRLPNGTYLYVAGSVPGFVTPPGGSLYVNGDHPYLLNLTFVPVSGGPAPAAGPGTLAYVALALIVIAIAGAVIVLRWRRGPREPSLPARDGASDEPVAPERDGTSP